MSQYVGCDTSVEAFANTVSVSAATEDDTRALTRDSPVVAPRERPAPWLNDVLNAIDRLLTLRANWDSYGANAVNDESITWARELARFLSGLVSVDRPSVTATPDGDVAFCWDTGDWSLDASVDRTGLISYAFLDERDPSKEREGRTRNVGDLVELVTRW